MATNFHCETCDLFFALGWNHYHHHDKYSAFTLLVCKNCGTMHRIEHAVKPKKPQLAPLDGDIEGLHDTLFCLSGPLRGKMEQGDLLETAWIQVDPRGDIRPWIFSRADAEGLNEPLELTNYECHLCKAQASLISDYDFAADFQFATVWRCILCQQSTVKLLSVWMT